MSLFRRGRKGIFWYEFVVHGRRYRESTGTTSKHLAEKIERKRHRDLETVAGGIELEQIRPVLFSVAAKDWLKLKTPSLADKTATMYEADIKHLMPHFGKLLVTDITAREIVDYITARRQKQIADKSIRNELGTLRGVLKRYKRWEAIKDDVRLPRGREDLGQKLSIEEEEKLLKACSASTSRSLLPVVTLALNTGMRHDEMRLLRWRQVDLINRAITVGKSKTDHGTGRAVPLNRRALEALETWAGQFPDRKPAHFVFPSEKFGISGDDEIPIAYNTDPTKAILSWKTSWSTARTAAGVSCRFHDLRHTTVTRLLERGAAFATVATLMGWSPGTAMRMAKRYGHIGKSAQRDTLALLDPPIVASAVPETSSAPTSPHDSTLMPEHSTVQ
jgi:integrase